MSTSIISQLGQPGVAAAAFATLLLFFCLKRVANHALDPQRNVPGPFWARYTRLWLLKTMMSMQSREILQQQHEKYGQNGILDSLPID
jgi:hypothetical protein